MISPGRELDALVAQHVMGLEVVRSGKNGRTLSIGEPDYYDDHGLMELFNPVPEYSTSIAAAWEVVEKLRHDVDSHKRAWKVSLTYGGTGYPWHCEFSLENDHAGDDISFVRASAETSPHAICLAALKVVGVDVSEIDSK